MITQSSVLSPHPFHRRIALTALAAIALLSSLARADWTLTSADFKDIPKLTVNEFTLKDGASVNLPAGTLQKFDTKDILAFTSDRARTAADAPWIVTLRNGDILLGTPADSTGDNLTLTLPENIDVSIPLNNVASMIRSDAQPTHATTTRDVLTYENNDKLEGSFAGVKGTDILFKVSGNIRKVDVNLKKLTINFAGVTPARTVPPLSARITFASGSVFTVPDVSWRLNDFTFTDPAGTARQAKLDKILSVEILGGRAVFLTELDPVIDQQTSLLATNWPTQINKNVLGQPLKLSKQTFSRGIGVHTTSTLAYELDGSFNNLTLQAGVDDSAAPYGQADLSILLDGKILWEKKAAKAGAISEVLNLPIKGGRKLELRATQAEKLDVQGRVDWVNVALIR